MIDLKQLMQERSGNPPAPVELRYQQIRRRIALRRRRRVVLLAAAVTVILAIAGSYAGLPHQRVSPEPAETAPVEEIDGFVTYEFGRMLVQHKTTPLPNGVVSLTWTPTTLDFHFTQLCSGIPENIALTGSLLVNGNLVSDSSCGPRGGSQPARSEDWLRDGWIRAGEPITLTLTADDATYADVPMGSPAPMPAGGTLALAIYVPVPFEEYPLPPRPAELPQLADWTDCPLDRQVHSDPGNPLKPVTVSMPWHGNDLIFRWDTQTPGILILHIDGVKVITVGWWDYSNPNWSRYFNVNDLAAIPGWKLPADGQEVTVTFTPEHFIGAWQAGVRVDATQDDYRPCQ